MASPQALRQAFGWQWYAKLSAICFCTGASMEFFMIQTGFYEKVTAIEAQRRAELYEEAQRQLAQARQQSSARSP
eukprot:jgi/Mesen1/8766/ME000524S08062